MPVQIFSFHEYAYFSFCVIKRGRAEIRGERNRSCFDYERLYLSPYDYNHIPKRVISRTEKFLHIRTKKLQNDDMLPDLKYRFFIKKLWQIIKTEKFQKSNTKKDDFCTIFYQKIFGTRETKRKLFRDEKQI